MGRWTRIQSRRGDLARPFPCPPHIGITAARSTRGGDANVPPALPCPWSRWLSREDQFGQQETFGLSSCSHTQHLTGSSVASVYGMGGKLATLLSLAA